MAKILVLLISVASGITFFIITESLISLVGLFILTVLTRFRGNYTEVGRFIEMLFVFCLISTAINELGIYYPYSLILVLALLIVMIFYEGPEWGNLYFGPGKMKAYFKHTLLLALIGSLVFGGVIYLERMSIQNPVPLFLPLDALIVLGVGFALYLAIMEEIIFRSFLFQRAESAVGSVHVAILAQAGFYGLMYFRSGVPGSIEGIVLGTLFGIGLGYLVKKSESIYPAILVHFVVTFVIFVELTILGKF